MFLYLSENPLILYKEFETYTSAAEFIGCHSFHVRRIIDKDKLFKNKWILRYNLLNSDLLLLTPPPLPVLTTFYYIKYI